MSKYEFSIAYAGDTRRDDHSISVDTLAPALLAFGRMMREANAQLNGKKSKAQVSVVSDFEHKCFNINFEVALTFLESIKTLIDSENAKSAKDILEWLGILVGSGVGLFQLLKLLRGKKIKDAIQLIDQSKHGNIIVQIDGERNNVTVNQNVLLLAENPKVLRAIRDAFIPVGREGFDRMEVRDKEKVVTTIPYSDARDLVASCTANIDDVKEEEPDITSATAWLSVYSPVYDADAPSWRFKMGVETIYADIADTEIAANALTLGGALIDDLYLVELEIKTLIDEKGKEPSREYKIKKVLDFVRAKPRLEQADLFHVDGEKSDER
ncbi:MAG: hypothetical protein IPL47_06800 [Phyllobacteriaceae bacterium]|nr:hypothetical protein [Phyllobacteriaceae bacterium]